MENIIMTTMIRKVVFILPGFGDTGKENIYNQIGNLYSKKGIEPIILDIPWKRSIMSNYVNYFISELSKCKNIEIYTFGFSFGAMISLISSSKINIKSQILCSISPYWKEDLLNIKLSWRKFFGSKRMSDFTKYSRNDLLSNIKSKTTIIIGSKEDDIVKQVNKEIFNELINKGNFVIVKNASHDISNAEYFKEIENQISLI